MKRKILMISLAVCLLAVGVIGATLAYFTDKDEATNVFTVGNIKIELIEEFDAENAKLMPGSKTSNAVNKDTWIKNTGDNDAWVRMKIYIPSTLDQLTTPQYNDEGHLVAAAFNTVHMNTFAGVETDWNINKANVKAKAITEGDYAGYNEYVFYYNQILPAGETTVQLLDQIYMDKAVDCTVDENGNYVWTKGDAVIDYQFEEGVNIIVVAEAIQAAGFDNFADAFAAFDAQ